MLRLAVLLCLTAVAFAADPLRILTFNVRYPNPKDGPDKWELRRDFLVDTIRQANPDVMGTQELFYEQGEYIASKLPAYAWFGLSRRGNRTDEHMGVFYRKDRLHAVDSGDFWLSEMPEKPGSMSWNVSLPRMVTWAVFEVISTKRRFWYFNTHFPHRREDETARQQCARLIANRIALLDPKADVILTGDFNAPTGGAAYQALTPLLQDAWQKAPARKGPEGTFHGFSGKPGRQRIDWILYRGNFTPVSIDTITVNRDGRYPSDHFPVLAVLE